MATADILSNSIARRIEHAFPGFVQYLEQILRKAINDTDTEKAGRASSYTSGNVPSLDENSDLEDTGIAATNVTTLDGTQTLTNKTLESPVVEDFSNAIHDHESDEKGGQLDHGDALTGLLDDDHTQYLLVDGTRDMEAPLTFDDSYYWKCQKLTGLEFAAGGSGATWTAPDANTAGGYNLDADAEYVYFGSCVCGDWDAVSDMELIVCWETDVDNSGGNDADEVQIDVEVYMKGESETSTKNQSLSETQIIGKAARYTSYQTTFTIDYDSATDPIEVGDKMAFRLNFDATNSDIADIIVNDAIFRYKSAELHIEV